MSTSLRMLAVAALTVVAAVAQPVVTSALNNASYTLPELPNSGLAQGSMIAVFGQRLAADGTQLADKWPLETSMRGTSAKITVGGTTVDALMAYTTPGQIGIIVPSNTPIGAGTLTVTYNGTSAPLNIRIVKSAFGAFTRNSQGSGPGSVENASQGGRPINALNQAARPGEVMVLWGTGLGPALSNDAQPPQAGDLPTNVEVYVGGKRATVTYKGRSGCCASIDQIAFTIPADVQPGCYVPVVVKTDDVVSNFTSISVAATGSVCSDPMLSSQELERVSQTGSYSTGFVALMRTVAKMTFEGMTAEVNTDTGTASFSKTTFNSLTSSRGNTDASSVTMGACTVSTYKGDSPSVGGTVTITPLDAGAAINVARSGATKQLTPQQGLKGSYYAQLGGGMNIPGLPNIPGIPGQQPPFLEAGTYTIDNGAGASGPDTVGRFSVQMTLAQPLVWSNMDQITSVNRSAGQTVTWTGGGAKTIWS